jgi:predicted Fe-Mo cluster-binding NifX family protein
MRKLSIENLHSDCVVAADICSPAGNVLLNKGVTITPAMGRRLRNWGITFVFVEGESSSEESVKTEKVSSDKIKSDLYALFHGTLENPRMRRIFDAVCEHKIQTSGGLS